MKILLYVTTHLSPQHVRFLSTCWPNVLRSFAEVNAESSLAFFITPRLDANHSSTTRDLNVMALGLSDHIRNVTVIASSVRGKQAGAIAAMMDRRAAALFARHDWVLRLNPDVIVEDASYLLSLMGRTLPGSRTLCAILCNCHHNSKVLRVMSDFVAFRPRAIDRTVDPGRVRTYYGASGSGMGSAEHEMTRLLVPTLDSGRYMWLSHSIQPYCRVRLPGIVYHYFEYNSPPLNCAKRRGGISATA